MRRACLALLWFACAPNQVTVVMNAQNNSGQNGVATLTDLGGKTKVLVIVHKSDSPDPQPVHFHPGRCGEILAKFEPARDKSARGLPAGVGLPDINGLDRGDGVDPPGPTDGGVAFTQATLDVPLSTLTGGDTVINVHDSRDFALYVSCGNIN